MGVFNTFADAPDQIKKEGQEITIRFARTGPTTGRISWNIPPPAAGCAAGTHAYDGIVITINGKAVNYLSNSPKDGTYYNSPDATGDADMHSGDKLDGALVVGAFYHDRTTTYLDVNDILPKTPYYVSGYAVDAVGRYHREGVHAYSLPTGEAEWSLPDMAAKHDIIIDVVGGIDPSTLTGLEVGAMYKFVVKIDNKEYEIEICGANVQHYTDLVAELKEKLALLGDVYISPLQPYTDSLYFNATERELKRFVNSAYVDVPLLYHTADPRDESPGSLWFKPSDSTLRRLAAGWEPATYVSLPFNPASISCDQTWWDGTNVWIYKLTHWEKLFTYIQTRNPLLPAVLTCDHYWYNPTDGSVSVWDIDAKKWNAVDAIYFATDPNLLTLNSFWYDEKLSKVKTFDGAAWNVLGSVTYVETLPTDVDEYVNVANANVFLFETSTGKLFELVADVWTERVIVSFIADPLNRELNKLWWDSTADVLNVWDDVTQAWVLVTEFSQSPTSPALPQPVVENSAWYNPETKDIKLVFKTACRAIYPIVLLGLSPGALPTGLVWFDTINENWFEYDGAMFNPVEPMYYETDPNIVVLGYYWFDPDATRTDDDGNVTVGVLKVYATPPVTYVGGVAVTPPNDFLDVEDYTTSPIVLPMGMFWFNSVNDVLYVWTGKAWVESLGLATVQLVQPETSSGRSVLSFFTRGVGCGSKIEVILASTNLLAFLTHPIMDTEPLSGASGLRGGSLHQQLGVGDNGSPDERRAIHTFIRNALGEPGIKVELTKEQLDQCINLSLEELRKFSSFSYRRQVFFLDMKPNQQTYILTNKCVGFNKIVGVNSLHRHRGLAMGAGAGGNDAFTYAAIQRLYSMGTFDMLSFHLVSSYMEEMETLFAARIMFNWKELERELSVYTKVWKNERILVDAYVERTEQDLMIDRNTGLWLKRFALAEAKKILSQTRGKFVTLPGPNGSTTLNAQDLQTQAEAEMDKLREQLEDNSMQDLSNIGLRAHLILG